MKPTTTARKGKPTAAPAPLLVELDPLVVRYLKGDVTHMLEEIMLAAQKGELLDVVLMLKSVHKLAAKLLLWDVEADEPEKGGGR